MFPITHFITSLILIIVLYPVFGFWSLAILIGGFLIDFDHYLWYAMDKKNWNVYRCYKESINEAKKDRKHFSMIKKRPLYMNWDRLHIFHVWEFWVLMILLSLIHKLFFIITFGMILHLSLDFIDLFRSRVYGRRAVSYFGWLQRH